MRGGICPSVRCCSILEGSGVSSEEREEGENMASADLSVLHLRFAKEHRGRKLGSIYG